MAEKKDGIITNEMSLKPEGLTREQSHARRTLIAGEEEFNFCPDIDPEIRLKFLNAPFDSETKPADVD